MTLETVDLTESLEVIRISPDRWVAYAEAEDEPVGYVDRVESLEPPGLTLYVAVRAEDGEELGIYKSLAGALGKLEALCHGPAV